MEEFFNKTKVYFGKEPLKYLEKVANDRSLIVADPFLVESGMIEKITQYLQKDKYKIFSHVVPDPPMELVVEGIQVVEEYNPHQIIAVGGGSAIDEAKAISYFAEKMDKKEGDLTKRKRTFIAIPTTSGTGSEVTSFAVITDKEKGVKYPLVAEELKPDIAILDVELVSSVPAKIVADTGMDVLTHALEAYVSSKANEFTDALAQKAALLVLQYLVPSYEDKENTKAREMMHYASCLAGMAFDETSLGLNHAIAHNIGGKFHIPHGRANEVLLPHVIEFNARIKDYQQKEFSVAAQKYAALAAMAGFGGANIRGAVMNLIHRIQKMQKQLKMPVNFRECGISMTDFRKEEDTIVAGALQDTCILTNPCEVTESDIRGILKKAM